MKLHIAVWLILSSLSLCASGCGPDCYAGEVIEALPAPFDEMKPSTDKAWLCKGSLGKYEIHHPKEDGGSVEAIVKTYEGGLEGLKPPTKWESSQHKITSYSEMLNAQHLVLASKNHIYHLELKDTLHTPGVVVIELEDISDSRLPPGLEAKAERFKAQARALFDLVSKPPEVKPCAPELLPKKTLYLSTAILADLSRLDDGGSTRDKQKLGEAMAKAEAFAIPARVSDVKPIINLKARRFEPGSVKGRVYVIKRAPQAILCAAPYEAQNSAAITFDGQWGNEDSSARLSLQLDLNQKAGAAEAQVMSQLFKGRTLERYEALLPKP